MTVIEAVVIVTAVVLLLSFGMWCNIASFRCDNKKKKENNE